MKVRVVNDDLLRESKIYFYKEDGDRVFIAEPFQLVFKEVDVSQVKEPSLRVHHDIANTLLQELSNGLNKAGYVSNCVSGYKQQVESIKYHLEDMRKIALRDL